MSCKMNMLKSRLFTKLYQKLLFDGKNLALTTSSCYNIENFAAAIYHIDKEKGKKLMFKACIHGCLLIVSVLLFQGFNPDEKDRDGCTPLYCASQNGHTETVKVY